MAVESRWIKRLRVPGTALAVSVVGLAAFLSRAHDPSFASDAPDKPRAAVVISLNGHGLPNRGWTADSTVLLGVVLSGANAQTVVPEFEVLPLDLPFTGTPNVAGPIEQIPAGGRFAIRVPMSGFHNGIRYHWRARARNLSGYTSAWIGSGIFGVSITPPSAPIVESANVPFGATTNRATIALHWSASRDRTGIAYYQWANTKNSLGFTTWHAIQGRAVHLHALSDGIWHIAVRAVNRAGITSGPVTWTITIDRSAPHIIGLSTDVRSLSVDAAPAILQFDLAHRAHISFDVVPAGGAASVARVDLGIRDAGLQTFTWAGTSATGAFLKSGTYSLRVSSVDSIGNQDVQTLDGFSLDTQRIVVSLTKQDLTAYDGSTVLLHTLITSGGPETQTPVGTFHVIAKYSPYVMRSPWPKTNRLWYPDSPVNYAILFRDGGYFLHDAPWRSVFGPGTNTVDGIPGGNTTGTHGCVNVPVAAEAWLYQWSAPGTSVRILP